MYLNDLLNEIWRALAKPAGSYAEITARVNVSLRGQGLQMTTHAAVDQAIYQLRHASPLRYGWTIPHCKRGPTQADRLVRVAINATGAPLVAMKREAAQTGVIGTVSYVGTIMEHGVKMMHVLGPQLPAPKLQRQAKVMARKMKFIAEEAWEMLESLGDQKWG